jgi:hypothetical protein
VRDVSTDRDVAIAVDPNDLQRMFSVTRPDGTTRVQDVEALDADSYGVTIAGLYERGFYRLERKADDVDSADGEGSASSTNGPDSSEMPSTTPSTLLAVNGPADESQLAAVDRQRLVEGAAASGKVRWIAPGELVSIEGASVRGQNLWWWLVATVAACLVVEMTALAWPAFRGKPT